MVFKKGDNAKERLIKKCLICGKDIILMPHELEKRKYCSFECSSHRLYPNKPCSESTKNKISIANTGKHHTEEVRKKMSIDRTGKKRGPNTKETNQKISLALTGRKREPPTEKARRNMSLAQRKRKHNPLTEEHKRKLIFSHLGKKLPPFTEEHKQKIRDSNKKTWSRPEIIAKVSGENNPMYQIPKSEETIRKQKMSIIKSGRVTPTKDTSIEIKIQNFLKQLRIKFLTHQYTNIQHNYQCDILIPVQEGIMQPTIIECDGDAFHYNPKKYNKDDRIFKDGKTAEEQWNLDNARTQELIEKGFRVIRLWEHEIKVMDLNKFDNTLKC